MKIRLGYVVWALPMIASLASSMAVDAAQGPGVAAVVNMRSTLGDDAPGPSVEVPQKPQVYAFSGYAKALYSGVSDGRWSYEDGPGASLPMGRALAGCTWTGHWTGYFQRIMAAGNSISGVEFGVAGLGSGNLDLTVDEECNVKGTLDDYTARVSWTNALEPPGKVSHCDMAMSATIPSGKASDALKGPAFDLDLSQVKFDWSCNNPPPSNKTNPPPSKVHFEPSGYADGTAHGDSFAFDTDNITAMLNALKQTGAKVSITDEWELSNEAPGSAVVIPEKGFYFLENVTVQNTYTATVDWQGNTPGKVRFSLAGQSVDVDGEDQAQATFNMGQVPAGKNELTVTAFTAKGESFPSGAAEVIVVPLEPWSYDALIQNVEEVPSAPVDYVTYSGTTQVPKHPITLPYLDMSTVPIIGGALGKWGIPPFQVQVGLEATSAGGLSDPAPVSGKAELYLGGTTAGPTVNITGHTVTDLTESSLLLNDGYADFKMAPYSFEHDFGAVTLVPGLATACKVPVVCDAIKGALNVAKVTVSFVVEGEGHGDLSVRPDQSELYFDNGTISPALTFEAAPNLGFTKIAAVGVDASGTGKVTWEIAPSPGLKSCTITLTAGGSAWAFGTEYPVKVTSKPLPCGPTVYEGKTYLSVIAPPGLVQSMQRSAVVQVGDERLRGLSSVPGGEVESQAISPAAGMSIASAASGDRAVLAYAPMNPGGVYLRWYDGSAWGDPITLAPETSPSFSAQAALDAQGSAIVVWNAADPDANPDDLAQLAGSLELEYAVVGTDGSVLDQGRITTDRVPDLGPTIASDGAGHVWLSWLKSPSLNLWGTAANPNQLMAARWDGDAWSEPETVAGDLIGTLNYALAVKDASTALIVADVDLDSDPATVDDRELVAVRRASGVWADPVQVTDNQILDTLPLVAYTSDGKSHIAWEQGGEVVGLDDMLNGTVSAWPVAGGGTIPDLGGAALADDGQGGLSLLYRAFGSTGQAIWRSRRPSGGANWQEPTPAVEVEYGFGRYAAAPAPDGGLWIAYASLTAPDNEQDFVSRSDLFIDHWTPETPAAASPGIIPPFLSNIRFWLIGGVACLCLGLVGAVGLLAWFVSRRRRRRTGQPAAAGTDHSVND